MCAFLETFASGLRTSESVAIWLEAGALVAIFFLDWRERKDQRKERQKQHEETAALHRPFIGLESLPTERLGSNTIWEFPTRLWNFGTLPASHLSASFAFYTESAQESRYLLKTIEGPESVEIFPNSGYEIALQPTPNADQVNQICSQSKS